LVASRAQVAQLPPLSERFDSPLHEISIDYPSGWQVRPATEPWTDAVLDFDSPAADVLSDPALGNRLFVLLSSQPYGGVQPDDWKGLSDRDLCLPGGGGAGVGSVRVGGVWGYGGIRCGTEFAEVRTAKRGYVIFLRVLDGKLFYVYDWTWFEALVSTVVIRPKDAS
jgi:hypothetical protein